MSAIRKEIFVLTGLVAAFACTLSLAVMRSKGRVDDSDPVADIEKPYYRPRPNLVGKFPLVKEVEANVVTSVRLDGVGQVDLKPRERKEHCLLFRIPGHIGITPLTATARVDGRPAAPMPIESTSREEIGCIRVPLSIQSSGKPFEVELFLGLNRMERWQITY